MLSARKRKAEFIMCSVQLHKHDYEICYFSICIISCTLLVIQCIDLLQRRGEGVDYNAEFLATHTFNWHVTQHIKICSILYFCAVITIMQLFKHFEIFLIVKSSNGKNVVCRNGSAVFKCTKLFWASLSASSAQFVKQEY